MNRSFPDQSNLYAYEGWHLSNNLFYWAKNISQAKLWQILFIPELSKVEDNLKTSWPSPLRSIINFVISKIVKWSPALWELERSFEEFNSSFKWESSSDNFSIATIENDINDEIWARWVNFWININKINTDDIVKNLISPYMKDLSLNPWNNEISIDSFWQWLQRNLIYSLIKMSTKYKDINNSERDDFEPDFTLILFEEPEVFLHPTQQDKLNLELKELSESDEQQILITSHSPNFISKNVEDIPSIIRISKDNWISKHFQITQEKLNSLFLNNNSFAEYFSSLVNGDNISDNLKWQIRNKHLDNDDLDKESIRYYLWLDVERTQSFFSKIVILCEWPTEKIFFNYLLNTEWKDLKDKQIYILETWWKFNIHRFMNLFWELWIYHSIIMDSDNTDLQNLVNQFINNNSNNFTARIDSFNEWELEDFLWIEKPETPRLKPYNVLKKYKNNEISAEKINSLKEKFINLI